VRPAGPLALLGDVARGSLGLLLLLGHLGWGWVVFDGCGGGGYG
jgi:hypothetical protein